ncbi:crossover junction endodeoxyribonuclease RuvC [Candidatus Kaiserbacteria bacterium CG10_big_fil_rev_8_21_14_0_10_45_20]|uniref:Crossover junction endodeoxyribonuclease RuvC n=1 Tax=Candidatus Kaiserbacteria bacterium CG10_big_fil_rev_8_21_14_0_10_45_20 TaxID=1974607 RepID=A0A2H0UGY5_9BACT|nr:MAG: crossover junction endodeoxyribonuclease RuvC [Candidatus Kaiserbacteria bacterium CG10_big_fil_rev_8_21_14_0_10_45_20]
MSSVLAIDPGYDRLGLAVFEGDEVRHSECFSPTEKEFGLRLLAINKRVSEVIDTFSPDAVAIETLFFTKNQKTAMRVAEARGVIILAVLQAHIPLFEYSPQEVKIAVTGIGNASKDAVMRMVPRLIKLPAGNRKDDEFDAIALGYAHQANKRLNRAGL